MKTRNQEIKKLECVFEIANLLNYDLTACGKMLSEANDILYLPVFEHTATWLSMRYGTARGSLPGACRKGETEIEVLFDTTSPPPPSKILIYDKETRTHEIHDIQGSNGSRLILKEGLGSDYRERSTVVVFDHIVWECIPKRSPARFSFSRVVNGKKRFKWRLNVTDFDITYFPESVSVLYRIEIARKEHIRGYQHLPNLVDEAE